MEAHRRLRAEQRRRPDLVCSLALSGVRGRLVSRSGEPTASQQLRECFIIASASAPVDPRRPGRRLHLDLGDIQIARGELDLAVLRAGEAHKFMAARTMGTANDTVTISWLESPTSPKRQQWARPLPPRPPR